MKKEVFKFLVLLMVALGAGPAGAALWQWSQTNASNGNADPSINWQIGMAPSAVDPSARAMMARIAEWRDDISGLLATTGTATAYAVTTNQGNGGNGVCGGGSTPTNGQALAITPHLTNGTNPTITVDGCSAISIYSSTGVKVPSGTLVAGTPYNLKYSSANTGWMLGGFYASPTLIPLGAMVPYTGTTAPNSNFILPAGQCISNVTYATYWALVGSPGNGSCAAGQFAVFDTRGRVLAGLDNLNGTAAGRLTSASYGCGSAMTSVGAVCANGLEYHTLSIAEMPSHYHSAGIYDPTHTHSVNQISYWTTNSGSGVGGGGSFGVAGTTSISINGASTGVRVNSANGLDTTYSNGGSNAHPIVQPTAAVTYLLRVL